MKKENQTNAYTPEFKQMVVEAMMEEKLSGNSMKI